MLIQYIRNKKGHRIGIVVAIDKDKIGWSLCKKNDVFDLTFGIDMAVVRAKESTRNNVAHTVKVMYERMAARAERYFKSN